MRWLLTIALFACGPARVRAPADNGATLVIDAERVLDVASGAYGRMGSDPICHIDLEEAAYAVQADARTSLQTCGHVTCP